jgi:hypothetical protein
MHPMHHGVLHGSWDASGIAAGGGAVLSVW